MSRARRPWLAAALLCGAAALLPPQATAAETVWISRGAERGQGTMVELAGRCLAVTAGHVAGDGKSALTLVDAARNSATARTVVVDTVNDLALLEVPDPRGAGRAICTRTPRSIPVWTHDQALKAAGRVPLVWLDKVNSASGELSRFTLALQSRAPAGRLHLDRAAGPHGDTDPAPGDSGSPVWMGTVATLRPERIFQTDRMPKPVSNGYRSLLGLYVGRSQDHSVVVAGDRVRHFVLQALAPLDPTALTLAPATVTLHGAARGAFGRAARPAPPEIDDTALQTLSLELDLGRRETTVSAVTLVTDRPAGAAARGADRYRLAVQSSAYRPGEATGWAAERCARDATRGAGPTRCGFSSPKVARGLRLEISGPLPRLRGIEIETLER